jgi:quercetin dioxygenase-like cupin family protein
MRSSLSGKAGESGSGFVLANPEVKWTVNGETFEGGAGDIFIIKAGEIHSFKVIGEGPLVQVDLHLSPRFIQENLGW